ncbi:MAG TPA: hypothetical protein VMP86_04455 [Candidatus Binatia bacterium]|nr:hypothetical protein [Candidatus Binatia bacterium]
MTRQSDFDHLVTEWLDEGAERAPERFVWAALEDVERTPQRGAWVASTEEFLMQLKRAAPVLGIAAAAVVLVIIASQIIETRNVGDPEPTPRAYTEEDVEAVVMTEANAPDGMTVEYENQTTGFAALLVPLKPGGETIDRTGFLDALSVELGTSMGGFTSWSALFESADAAQQAYDFLVTEHESPEGWGLAASREDPKLGEESVMWTGRQYDMASARTILWRQGNLLLAAVGWADWEPEEVRLIADQMADRAR